MRSDFIISSNPVLRPAKRELRSLIARSKLMDASVFFSVLV